MLVPLTEREADQDHTPLTIRSGRSYRCWCHHFTGLTSPAGSSGTCPDQPRTDPRHAAAVDVEQAVASADHLDLLVSATRRWVLLLGPAAAAFTPAAAAVATAATPGEVGRLLLAESLAAARWRASRGRLPLPGLQPDYEFREVHDLEPVQVLKATHGYRNLAAGSPSWPSSLARQLSDALLAAATERLPGYAAAPERWTRPATRTGLPVGLARSWRPVQRGVVWLTPTELPNQWDNAALVVLAADALEDLPAGLPCRPGVYVCAAGEVAGDEWPAVTQLQPGRGVSAPGRHRLVARAVCGPDLRVPKPSIGRAAGVGTARGRTREGNRRPTAVARSPVPTMSAGWRKPAPKAPGEPLTGGAERSRG